MIPRTLPSGKRCWCLCPLASSQRCANSFPRPRTEVRVGACSGVNVTIVGTDSALQSFADGARRGRLIEGIKVNAGRPAREQVTALCSGVLDANAAHGLLVVADAFQARL